MPRPNADPNRLLAIYLNDHLAGATLGVELARRLRGSNRGDSRFGAPLVDLCGEIEADRQILIGLLDQLGIRRDPIKPALAWTAEKLGRLKLNGQLIGYSPLSRLDELEMLALGIAGKTQLWQALERTLGERIEGVDLRQLAERAREQRHRVEELHAIAAAEALPDRPRN